VEGSRLTRALPPDTRVSFNFVRNDLLDSQISCGPVLREYERER
jgi:hypothetical protein